MEGVEALIKVIGATVAAQDHLPNGCLNEVLEKIDAVLEDALAQAKDDATRDAR